MRISRLPLSQRIVPLTLTHGWWRCDEIVDGCIPNAAGGSPLMVRNGGASWSDIASGVLGNRVSKSAQISTDFIYGEGSLFTIDPVRESFSWWGWLWPESPDLNSDSFTQPLMGSPPWLASESGANCSCYFGNVSASLTNARDGSSSSASNAFTLGPVGAKLFLAYRFDIATRKIAVSKNGAAFVNASTVLGDTVYTDTGCQFNLGNYVLRGVLNPNVSSPGSRNLRGKWDEVAYVRGKALSDADAAWLYNSGNGRSYEVALGFGLFRAVTPYSYPNLNSNSFGVLTLNIPSGNPVGFSVTFSPDGYVRVYDNLGALYTTLQWLNGFSAGESVADTYQVTSVNQTAGTVSFSGTPFQLSSVFSVTASAAGHYMFQVNVDARSSNPRFGDPWYFGTHTFELQLNII